MQRDRSDRKHHPRDNPDDDEQNRDPQQRVLHNGEIASTPAFASMELTEPG